MTIIDQAPIKPETFQATVELEVAADRLVDVIYFAAPSLEAFEVAVVGYINEFQSAYEGTARKQRTDWAGVVVGQFNAISARCEEGYFPAIGIEDARKKLTHYLEDEKANELRQIPGTCVPIMPYALTMLIFDQIDAIRKT